MATRSRTKRPRLSADDAKRAILDAAEAQLEKLGPEGLRLQAIADEVGVGHSALLYHFGSREAIIDAVVERIVSKTFERELDTLEQGVLDPAAAFDRLFAELGDKRQSRLQAWLALSGVMKPTKPHREFWTKLLERTHTLRSAAIPDAQFEDTAFAIILCSFVLLGEDVIGDIIFQNAGVDKETRKRFRPWLAMLVMERLAR